MKHLRYIRAGFQFQYVKILFLGIFRKVKFLKRDSPCRLLQVAENRAKALERKRRRTGFENTRHRMTSRDKSKWEKFVMQIPVPQWKGKYWVSTWTSYIFIQNSHCCRNTSLGGAPDAGPHLKSTICFES